MKGGERRMTGDLFLYTTLSLYQLPTSFSLMSALVLVEGPMKEDL